MIALLVVGLLGSIFPSGSMSNYEYPDATKAMASTIAQIVISGLLLFLIYRLAFGTAANAFFAEPTPDE